MSFFNNRRVSGKGVIRSRLKANQSKAGALKRWLTRKIMFPAIYHWYALRPIQDDKVIFMEIRLGELTDTYQEIFNKLVREYKMDVHCHFFLQGKALRNEELKREIDFIKDAATAKYLIYNDSSDVQGSFKVRKGSHVLNTWHGAGAFKKFGLSTINKIFGGSVQERTTYNLHPSYDMVTVSSPEVAWAYVEAMGKDKEPDCVKPVGISRTDVFYRQEFIDAAYGHLYDVLPNAKNKKIILYAPTFRGQPRHAKTPDMLIVGEFYKHFKDDYILIFKHHPLVKGKPTIPTEYSKFAVDLSDVMSISELLCVTDICITDYSSLIFEYAIFERPMIFFAYDLANYFDWRGFYYNYDELTPGPICYTNAEMIDYIEHIDERFDKNEVHRFREKFMSSCDGKATDRIFEQFFGASIEKYRREEPLTGDFHELPDANSLYRDENKKFENMKKIMGIARKAYNKALKQPVVPNRIVLLMDEASQWDTFYAFEKALNASGKHYEIVKDIYYNTKNIAPFIEKLAGASYIVCSGEPYVMRMLNIRKETKIIQICPELFPIGPRWNNSKQIRSGYNVEECKTFPIHTKYDVITCNGDADKEFLEKNYALSENGKVVSLGNITLDVLYDEEYKKNARERIDKICPYASGKGIILFLCKDRDSVERYLNQVMTMMHEAFARNYVCVGMVCDGKPGRKVEISEYLEGFAFDPKYVLGQRVAQQEADNLDNDVLPDSAAGVRLDKVNWKGFAPITIMEAISAAEVVVGDYTSYMFAAAILRKPLYIWALDQATYGREQEMYSDFGDTLQEIRCSSNRELVQRILHKDEYDFSVLDNFIKTHFAFSDGKASQRLESIL